MIRQITKFGWHVIEAGFLLVILCVLLNIILGRGSGGFISSVAANALDFMQKVPAGTFLGVFLILALYWVIKAKDSSKA
jgi:phosphotransferase system  glucose/maltose/N-acetylglucosamine-specific IIC component